MAHRECGLDARCDTGRGSHPGNNHPHLLVGLAGFTNIIAGSIDVVFLVFSGQRVWSDVVANHIVPTLIGNIIGGVSLVAAVNHAQVVSGGSTRAKRNSDENPRDSRESGK
jgi:hypothetical protein